MGYLLGIVSIFNALVDVELEYIFKELSLRPEIKSALENQSGKLGHCYALCLSIESNNLLAVQESTKYFNLNEDEIMKNYAEALGYADESLV